MPEIILTEEQARQITDVLAPVRFVDSTGRLVGHMHPVLTSELIAEIKKRAAAPGPSYSGAQIQSQLKALNTEWARLGGFDADYMRRYIEQLEQSDPSTYGPKRSA